jgi:hypothetical protein
MDKDRFPAWLLPEVKLASRPALVSLVLLLLFGLGAVLACWTTRLPPESDDFDLNTARSSPKLDVTSAEAHIGPSAEAFPSVADDSGWFAKAPEDTGPKNAPVVLEIPAPDASDSAGAYKIPDLPEAPAAKTAPEPTEPAPLPAPIDFDAGNLFNSSLRGDTPMIRTWKMLGYPAILAAAFSTTPQLAWTGEKEKNAQGTDANTATLLKDLKEDMAVIKRSLEANGLKSNVIEEDLRKLGLRVAQLEKDMDALHSRTTSTSNYQPTIPAKPAAGRIHLINTWNERVTLFLNDKAYHIEPNREITITDVPAGTFTYQVIEERADSSIQQITQKLPRTLAANETFTINVHPR